MEASDVMLELGRLDKDELRKEFGKDFRSYYSTKLFEEKGFSRRKCAACGKNFWSIIERDSCEDPEHTQYSFFRKDPKPVKYVDFWKKFAGFFSKNGHAVIERYPVVSRWRQDLYFTIASIQDFQRVENGAMGFEYGANPLIVPQICLRFSDIENVGVTGRHLTSFMMAGQHSFNYPNEGYWRDKTVELNYKFLTEELGVDQKNLVYNEDVWAMGDFSEFGPCLESFSNGVELVNSVFTQFESVNGKARELPGMVVDVGWGFERLLWFYTGFDNAYEAVFSEIIGRTRERLPFELGGRLFRKFAERSSELDVTEKGSYRDKVRAILKSTGITEKEYNESIRPAQAYYAVLDHSRTLLFAIADGALPSNIGGGYNLRVILRRALAFIEEHKMGIDLMEMAEMHAHELKGLYPELQDSLGILDKVIGIESKRYEKTVDNAGRIIEAVLKKKEPLNREKLKTLYESNGITPELISSIALSVGKSIEMPDGAYEDIIQGDFVEKKKGGWLDVDLSGIHKTEQLYYRLATEAEANVLLSDGKYIVLDRTPFYPEGGGQEADHGTIAGIGVVDVQKAGDVIVHIIDEHGSGKIIKGARVRCEVDKERRNRLMAHHTSTHLMSAAARNVLGKHAWQEGTKKSYDKAHIDVTHYDRLTEEEEREMENFVNGAILNGMDVEIKEMDRGAAEGEFGFSIYQGHGMPTKRMRMVIIRDKKGNLIDAEACGGLHVSGREYSIGIVKMIGSARIHDGVDRVEFVAGNAALDRFREEHTELSKAALFLNTDMRGVAAKEVKLKEENAGILKKVGEMEEKLARLLAERLYSENIIGSKEKAFAIGMDERREVMRKVVAIILEFEPKITVMSKNGQMEVVCIRGPESGTGAMEFVREKLGDRFRGGGSQDFAEGIESK